MLKIGDTYKQTNPIEQYGFNYVGRTFRVKEIQLQGVIMICDDLGLCCGIELEQLPNYFERCEDIVDDKYDGKYERVIRNGNVTIVILKMAPRVFLSVCQMIDMTLKRVLRLLC